METKLNPPTRGGKMVVGPKMKARTYLDLLVSMFSMKENTIRQYFHNYKLSMQDPNDVAHFIRKKMAK